MLTGTVKMLLPKYAFDPHPDSWSSPGGTERQLWTQLIKYSNSTATILIPLSNDHALKEKRESELYLQVMGIGGDTILVMHLYWF